MQPNHASQALYISAGTKDDSWVHCVQMSVLCMPVRKMVKTVLDLAYVRGASSYWPRALSHCVTCVSKAHICAAFFKHLVLVSEPNPLLVRGGERSGCSLRSNINAAFGCVPSSLSDK